MNGIYVIVWSYIKENQAFAGAKDRAFISYKEAEAYAEKEAKNRSYLSYQIDFVFISDHFNLAYYL